MRFTNICGMTIPERMIALQEMMQSLINAVYGEYRWTANVSHVSETNIFTATNIINFDNSDFIVGQTVLFTDSYLGVVVEVDNSVTPKQFTAAYYMEIKGDKGANGLNALTYNDICLTSTIPPIVISFPSTSSRFNRAPIVGDVFSVVFKGAGSVSNRSWMGIYKVTSLGAGVVNCSGSIVETTGQQGKPGQDGAGLIKRYMHSISYMGNNTRLKFNIFTSDPNQYSNFSEFIAFFSENNFDSIEHSFPATGVYNKEGIVWGVYYNPKRNSMHVLSGTEAFDIEIGIPPSDIFDTVVDLEN